MSGGENISLSSDDEAPEDISFKSSKKTVMDKIMLAKTEAVKDKIEAKQKKIDIQERNIKQKAKKKRKLLEVGLLVDAEKSIKDKKLCRKVQIGKCNTIKRFEENNLEEGKKAVSLKRTQMVKGTFNEAAANFKHDHFFNGRIKRMKGV